MSSRDCNFVEYFEHKKKGCTNITKEMLKMHVDCVQTDEEPDVWIRHTNATKNADPNRTF